MNDKLVICIYLAWHSYKFRILQLLYIWPLVYKRQTEPGFSQGFFFSIGSSDGVLGHHWVTWWSFSVPCRSVGDIQIKWPIKPLISSTKLDCLFFMNKQTLLSCLDWYCEAALIQSVLWKALYKYIWLDLTN